MAGRFNVRQVVGMTFLEISLGVSVVLVALFVWLGVRTRRMTLIKVEGCTIMIRDDGDITSIVYREPSGDSVTVEAYWVSRKNPRKMNVEFPSTLSFGEVLSPSPSGEVTQLGIPKTRSLPTPLPESKVAEIRERISQGLTKLKILHDFVRPQLSGWTSIEDGKEIYHGTDGVIQDRD